jgi:hypothetical protein
MIMPCSKKKRKGIGNINEKGSISFYIIFVFLAFITLTLFVFLTPIMMDFNTRIYTAGEIALIDANETASQIQNADVRASFQSSLTSSQNSIPNQVAILSFFFQYAWIIVILVILLSLFIYTRQSVEAEKGGLY